MDDVFKRFLGRPFLRSAFDCWTLIEEFYAQFGYFFDCSFRYKHDLVKPDDICFRYFKDWHRVDKPRKGDLVLFKKDGLLYHGGIMLSTKSFMHNMIETGVIVTKITRGWQTRIHGFYRNDRINIL